MFLLIVDNYIPGIYYGFHTWERERLSLEKISSIEHSPCNRVGYHLRASIRCSFIMSANYASSIDEICMSILRDQIFRIEYNHNNDRTDKRLKYSEIYARY